MAKTILGVLSLLVIMSCSIPVKENTVQPNIKNHKTFCDVFSNRFASVLQPLTQNEM